MLWRSVIVQVRKNKVKSKSRHIATVRVMRMMVVGGKVAKTCEDDE